MKALPLALLGAGLVAGCNSAPTSTATETAGTSATALLTPGPWRGELAIQGQQLPFLFEVKTESGKPVVYLINKGLNGEERLRCDEISAAGDSATIKLHVFDAALVVRADGKDKLKGVWVKYDAKTPYRVPLVATAETVGQASKQDGPSSPETFANFEGTWRTTFKDETGKTYPAVGVFKTDTSGWKYAGTFLTSTGDYRYLTGYSSGPRLELSTFDGNHAFLFTGVAAGAGEGTAYLTKPVKCNWRLLRRQVRPRNLDRHPRPQGQAARRRHAHLPQKRRVAAEFQVSEHSGGRQRLPHRPQVPW
jgi:hypothetical protein